MFKKTISVLLSVLLTAGLVPAGVLQAFADDSNGQITADYTLSLGSVTTVSVTEEGQAPYCAFTPAETGVYAFFSTADEDTYAELYDADGGYITYNDEGGENNNFRIEQSLNGGSTYYLQVRFYSSYRTGDIPVTVVKKPAATSMTIQFSGSGIKQFSTGEMTQAQLKAAFAPEDCVDESVSWTSSDNSVVSVSEYGFAQFWKAGTATVTAASENGLTASCAVTVTQAPAIQEGEGKACEIAQPFRQLTFRFVPSETRQYRFYSTDNSNSSPNSQLLNSDGTIIATGSSSSGEEGNFSYISNLTANETYYYRVGCDYDETATFTAAVEAVPFAESISLNYTSLTGYPTGYEYLSVSYQPEDAMRENISWTSSDDSIVSVDSYGYLEMHAHGRATVTATSARGLKATCSVTVNDYLSLTAGKAAAVEIDRRESFVMCRFVPGADGTYDFISSDNDDKMIFGAFYDEDMNHLDYQCATMDDGNFRIRQTLEAGKTYYLRTGYDNYSQTGGFKVCVTAAAEATGMEIVPDEAEGHLYDTIPLELQFTPEGAIVPDVTWTSSDETVATVDENGNVNLCGVGTAIITAAAEGGLSAACTVTAKDIETITVGETKTAEIESGCSAYFRFVPEETREYLFYSTGDSDTYGYLFDEDMNLLETDDESGENSNFKIVSELEAGKTYFWAAKFYYSSTSGSFNVTLRKNIPATGIVIEQGGAVTGSLFDTLNLTAAFVPADAAPQEYYWSTSDGEVASVNNGELYLGAVGTADITVSTDNGLSAACKVTVSDHPVINKGETKRFTLGETDVYYKIVPAESYVAAIYTTGSCDTKGILLDAEGNTLDSDDQSGENSNFSIVYALDEGETCYIRVGAVGAGGNTALTLESLSTASSMYFEQGESYEGYAGTSFELQPRFRPEGAPSEAITSWRSSNTSIATVSNGTVTMRKSGRAVITATSENGLTASCTVTVRDCERLTVGESKSVVISEAGKKALYLVTPAADIIGVFTSTGSADTCCTLYDASMTKLAYDDDGGEGSNFRLTYGLKGGRSYYLEAGCYGDYTGSFTLFSEATVAATAISIREGDAIEGYKDNSLFLHVVCEPEDSYAGELSWSSSDSSIVSVGGSGYAKMKDFGTATVTVTTDTGLQASVAVTVRDYETIHTGETKNVDINYPGKRVMYRFVPEESGCYVFYTPDEMYTQASIYDSELTRLRSVSAPEGFRLSYMLEAGETYYYAAQILYTNETGSFDVTLEQTEYVTGLTITELPERTTYVEGFVGRYVDYSGMKVRVSWSDGEQSDWSWGDSRVIRSEILFVSLEDTTVTVECGDRSDSFELSTIENPVERIEADGSAIALTEEADGEWIENGSGRYFRYSYSYTDIPVTIYRKDGTVVKASAGDVVDGYSIEANDGQYAGEHWTVGGDNTITVSYLGATAKVHAAVTENPVAGIRILGDPEISLIEGNDCAVRSRYNPETDKYEDFDYYYLGSEMNKVKVEITFKDGTKKTARVGGMVGDYWIEYDGDQYKKPFSLGKNTVTVSYMGKTDTLTANLAESPVARLELPQPVVASLYENAKGYWTNHYNPETGNYDKKVFIYSLPDLSGVPVRIVYKNGMTVDAHIGDTVDGYEVTTNNNQYDMPWTIGDNTLEVFYLGKTAEATVTVLPNPVARLELVTGTAVSLIENADGYPTSKYNPETGDYDLEYFYYRLPEFDDAVVRIVYTDGTEKLACVGENVDGYEVYVDDNQSETPLTLGENALTVTYMGKETAMPVTVAPTPVKSLVINNAPSRVYVLGDVFYAAGGFAPDDITGLKFTVNFKDGTKKTYAYTDMQADGSFDGHTYLLTYPTEQKLGNNPVKFSYLGKETTYNVKVVENTVSSLEVVKLPDKPTYSQYYSPDWRGLQVRVTKKDGTKKTYTFSDSNMVYGFNGNIFGHYVGAELDGMTCVVNYSGDEDDREYTLYYAGQSAPVTGMTYRKDPTVTDVKVEDFSQTGENMLLKVTYENGTKEDIRLTDVKACERGWLAEALYGRALTDKGVLPYYIAVFEGMPYDVSVFGINVKLDKPATADVRGDVTGDGKVTVDDATRLQSYLAEYSVPNVQKIKKCGDANRDGVIDIRDITAIQRYLADVENTTGIGEAI